MGHKNKISLTKQVQNTLDEKLRIGCSKHTDKIIGVSDQYIYSYGTYKTYLRHCIYFAKFCKEKYGCKTLDECKEYIGDWIDSRRNLSPYTLKMELSAVAKLYGTNVNELGIKTPPRKRENIIRSRGPKEMDKHFSEKNNEDLIMFCKCTGLRRAELTALRGNKLISKEGMYYILVNSAAKGGREREAPVIGSEGQIKRVVELMNKAGNDKVFRKISHAADIHSYRAEYATSIYIKNARKIEEIPFDKINRGSGHLYQSEVYVSRSDKKIKLDKRAMLEASRALGHNRISVVGEHYLRV